MLNHINLKIGSKNYIFRLKDELHNSEFQKILQTAKEKDLPVFCQCNNVKMKIKKTKNRFYISSYPNRKKQHSIFCEFYGSINDFYLIEKEKILISDFNLFLSSTQSYSKVENKSKETKKLLKFSGLVLNLLDNSYASAFNFVNKGKDRISGNLQNPDIKTVFKIFIKKFINIKMKNTDDFYKSFKDRGFSFKLGKVYQVGNDFIKTKTYYKGGFYTETIKIKSTILEKSLQNVQIFKNKIQSPYFFFLVKRKRTVQRLFIYPIVDSEYFLPVESEFEREKVKEFADFYCVYKPLLINSINNVLTKKYSLIYNKFNDVVPRPDLFVFTKGEIVVVEILGMENREDYIKRVKEKERFYKNLEKPFRYGKITERKI